ncbi:MAG: alpha/beta fold hydrolase [Chloroflexota bacterium]|nr:alpha/beta fold hydrolase [Chloroflexota bacterium]
MGTVSTPASAAARPPWLDHTEYPFESHFLDLPSGRMHYIDEGEGQPVVMVHGTPDWSFVYRHLVRCLSRTHRCIAVDHIGFGLSDKPARWTYTPADHARNLQAFIQRLGLQQITLVVHDFVGPIGLSYAIDHPENVSRLILFNTWLFSGKDTKTYRSWTLASRLFGSPVGRFLYQRLNFSPRFVLKMAFADKSKLSPQVHQHYIRALPTYGDRRGTWVFARELTGSGEWFDSLWARSDRIRDKPALLLWGMKDFATGPEFLEKFRSLFTQTQVVEYDDAGHFPQEEVGPAVCSTVSDFLAAYPAPGPSSATS